LFDSWAAELTPDDYRRHLKPVMKHVVAAVKPTGVPIIYFPGQGSDRMADLVGIGMEVVQVDWRIRLPHAYRLLKEAGLDVTLQGNLDPHSLLAPEEVVRERTRAIMDQAKGFDRPHIFNVGHGLTPATPPESLTWVVEELRR
jgi:uroporphyrinogen decarboxylase